MPDDPVTAGKLITGDNIGGDKIAVGNISDSYTAIGTGAQVIINQIQHALSQVDELEKSIQAAERRLAESIQKKLVSYAQLTAPGNVGNRSNPYKALLDYKLEDAPFFYGRSDAIQAMQHKMQQSRLTILHSDSGSGKTSLLQAGLASRLLAEGQFPLYLRPYDQPPQQFIKKAFLPDYATQTELQRFNDEQMTLHGFLEHVTHYLGGRRLIILLDQFEEFFTELQPDQQEAFARQLRECVESDLPVWWVPALRKEYFSDLRLFRALKPFENEYFLPTFKLDEAQEVIIEPVSQKGVIYEKGLVDQILDDIRQESEAIPPAQVQLVCYTLFDELSAADDSAQISFELYNQPRGRGGGAPGAEGILTSHLTRVLDHELKGQERKVAGRVLEALVTSDIRRVLRSRESLQTAVEPEQSAQLDVVLNVLYNNRLVRRELDENDQPVYELAHDYLLNEIELDPETQARKAAQELLVQEVRAYQMHGTLLSKDKFAIINSQRDTLQIDPTAAELLAKSENAITAEDRRELEQAQKLAEEQRLRAEEGEQAARGLRRRLILATGAVVIALFAFGAAVIFGLQSQDNANAAATAAFEADQQRDAALTASTAEAEQRTIALTQEAKASVAQGQAEANAAEAERAGRRTKAGELAAQSRLIMERDPELALLLAREAINIIFLPDKYISPEAEAALYEALNAPYRGESIAAITISSTPAPFSLEANPELWDLLQDVTSERNVIVFDDRGSESGEIAFVDYISTISYNLEATSFVTVECTDITFLGNCLRYTAVLRAADSGEEIIELGGHSGNVNFAAFTENGSLILTTSQGGSARVWSADGKIRRQIEGITGDVTLAQVDRDLHYLTTLGEDGTLRLWTLQDDLILTVDTGLTFAAELNRDGTQIMTAQNDRPFPELWHADDGSLIMDLEANYHQVLRSANYSPDGQYILGANRDRAVHIWDAKGELLKVINPKPAIDGISSAQFNHDNTQIVTAHDDGTLKVWPVNITETGEDQPLFPAIEAHQGKINSVTFNHDGTRFASTGEDGQVSIWYAVNGDQVFTIDQAHDGRAVNSVCFNQDSSQIVTAGDDGQAKVWNAADGQFIMSLDERQAAINWACFNEQGSQIAVAADDGLVTLWNAADGNLLTVLEACAGCPANHVSFSADGRRLLTSGADGKVKIWQIWDSIKTAMAEAQTRAGRKLTNSERLRYLGE